MSTIIYYHLLSKYCLLLSYNSLYRFHYRNSISTLEGLIVICDTHYLLYFSPLHISEISPSTQIGDENYLTKEIIQSQDQNSSILRDATQNDPPIFEFDAVELESPNFSSSPQIIIKEANQGEKLWHSGPEN